MQNYIVENQTTLTPVKIVRPNIHKIILKNIIFISSILAGIIAVLIYLNNIVGLDAFMILFDTLGIVVDPKNTLIISILIFLSLAIIFIIISYLRKVNVRYEFYKDKIKLYEPTALLFLTSQEISYSKIVKISYNYTGVMNKILNSGKIIIDVTGMKEGFCEMELIDQTPQVVEQLLKIVKEYNSLQQMQFEENNRINNIMNKF